MKSGVMVGMTLQKDGETSGRQGWMDAYDTVTARRIQGVGEMKNLER